MSIIKIVGDAAVFFQDIQQHADPLMIKETYFCNLNTFILDVGMF